MTYMTPSERRIEDYMARDRKQYGGDPYHYAEWTRGIRYRGWVNTKNPGLGLSWIPEMALTILDEAYEYNARFALGLWKPGKPLPKPEVDETREFDLLLHRHKELATMRAELSRLDYEAANEQSRLQAVMNGMDSGRWFDLATAKEETRRIFDYSDEL